MLKSGRGYLAFHKKLEAMVDLVAAVTSIIAAEKLMYLEDPRILHKRRNFATPTASTIGTKTPRDSASIPARKHSSFLAVRQGITLDNLEEVLQPLKDEKKRLQGKEGRLGNQHKAIATRLQPDGSCEIGWHQSDCSLEQR